MHRPAHPGAAQAHLQPANALHQRQPVMNKASHHGVRPPSAQTPGMPGMPSASAQTPGMPGVKPPGGIGPGGIGPGAAQPHAHVNNGQYHQVYPQQHQHHPQARQQMHPQAQQVKSPQLQSPQRPRVASGTANVTTYAHGDYVLCCDGAIYPAIVRFAGLFAGASAVGLEFMFAAPPGCNDGYSKSRNARAFTCAPGKGCYLEPNDRRLKRVSAEEAHEINWANLLSVIGMKLEEIMEENVLTGTVENAGLEAILKAHGHITSVWVKRWVPAQNRYLFFDRTKPCAPGRVQPPQNASIARSIEGGPEMKFASDTVAGPKLVNIHEGMVKPEEADALLQHLIDQPDISLHVQFMLPLLHHATHLFATLPSVIRVPCPAGGRVIVLGDTHGHWKDVVYAFKTFGTPSPTTVYLLNGDISDRADMKGERGGQQSLAIWSAILCYKLAYPNSVWVNRGNHEDWPSNIEQGPYGKSSFHAEISCKYPRKEEAMQVKFAFRELFYSLPLATVVGERVLVVHGGLCGLGLEQNAAGRSGGAYASLEQIEAINRRRDIPGQPKDREQKIMMDLLWSDPHDGSGLIPCARGPHIRKFGGDITTKVLRNEGLAMLIRSHDWPQHNKPHGHHWVQKQHGTGLERLMGQESICLTVFTASDYCGTSGNNGALVELRGVQTAAQFVQIHEWTHAQATQAWKASLTSTSVQTRVSGAGVIGKKEGHDEYLWGLKGLIVERKHELFMAFRNADIYHDFHLRVSEWKDICDQVCGSFPWEHLLGHVGAHPSRTIAEYAVEHSSAYGVEEPLVNYATFLSRHQIRFRTSMGRFEGFRQYFAKMLFNSMLLQDQSLRDTMKALDPDSDGTVTIEEFIQIISHVIPCISERQAAAMMRSTFAHSSGGRINTHQLLDSLVMRFQSENAKPVPANGEWLVDALHRVGKEIIEIQKAKVEAEGAGEGSSKVSALLHRFFIESDIDQNGYLEITELKSALQKLSTCATMSNTDLDMLCAYCDRNGDGRLNYLEFLAGFRIEQSNGMADQVSEDLLEAFFRVLYFVYRPFVVHALEQYIVPDSHTCTPAQFAAAIRAVNASRGLLTDDQIEVLIDTLDVDVDGVFDYAQYFESFEIIDTAYGVIAQGEMSKGKTSQGSMSQGSTSQWQDQGRREDLTDGIFC